MFSRIEGVVNLHLPSKNEPVNAELKIDAMTGEIRVEFQGNKIAEDLLQYLFNADLKNGICVTMDVMD